MICKQEVVGDFCGATVDPSLAVPGLARYMGRRPHAETKHAFQ